MERDVEPIAGDDVLFSYEPEPTFTRTFGWMIALLPVIGVISAVADAFSGQPASTIAITLVISALALGVLVGLSRLVDRAQRRIYLVIRSDGTIEHRNALGIVQRASLVDARSFTIRALRGKPRIMGRTAEGGFDIRRTALANYTPHFIEIRIRDAGDRKHRITLSGTLPRNVVRDLYEVTDRFVKTD